MPDQLFAKLAEWGLDVASITTLSVLTITLVELVKKHFGITGTKILYVSVISAALWSLVFFFPLWKTVIAATLLTTLTASGAWQAGKTLVGKIGEDAIKPAGSMDRGPSKPGT